MKPEDPLDELLSKWQVQTPAPSSFRREVWERIAVQNQPAPSFLDRLAGLFLRPVPITVGVALALLTGALLAWEGQSPPHRSEIAREQYLRSIDPFNPGHLMAVQ